MKYKLLDPKKRNCICYFCGNPAKYLVNVVFTDENGKEFMSLHAACNKCIILHDEDLVEV